MININLSHVHAQLDNIDNCLQECHKLKELYRKNNPKLYYLVKKTIKYLIDKDWILLNSLLNYKTS